MQRDQRVCVQGCLHCAGCTSTGVCLTVTFIQTERNTGKPSDASERSDSRTGSFINVYDMSPRCCVTVHDLMLHTGINFTEPTEPQCRWVVPVLLALQPST